MIQRAIRDSKDAALSFALRTFINARLHEIGEATELSVSSAHRQAHLRIALRGDAAPVDLHVGKYAIDNVDGQHWLTVLEARASREWLHGLLQQYAIDRPVAVSPIAAAVLRQLT